MKIRISQRLENHKNKLRQRALKAQSDGLRRDYWQLYNDAKDIEPEIREMVLKAENRHLLEMIIESGLAQRLLEEQKDNPPPPEDEPDKSDDKPPDHEDDIPPRQLGLWE